MYSQHQEAVDTSVRDTYIPEGVGGGGGLWIGLLRGKLTDRNPTLHRERNTMIILWSYQDFTCGRNIHPARMLH